jgi:CubicO group peptidase (beta-lactamase class C family)
MSRSLTNVVRHAWSRMTAGSRRPLHSSLRGQRRSRPALEALEDRLTPAGPVGGGGLAGDPPAVSVFDLDQFEQNLRDHFVDNAVGFGYAINQDGVTVRHDGWGDARKPGDGQVDFTEDTQMTIASVAKTITATSILKILQDTPGVGVNSFISPYLPSDWVQGPNINTITFRDLLTHQSGLRRVDWDGDGTADLGEQTSYGGLQQLIALGFSGADADANGQIDLKEQFSYENANFALMRVMTPYLLGNGDAADDAGDPAQFTADAYVEYVSDNVLAPMGIVNADTAPSVANQTLNYPYPGAGKTTTYADRTLFAGGEGWWLSADELAKFLIGVRTNDSVLSLTTRELMRDGFLGWMDPDHGYGFSEGMFGTYFSHGGDLNNLNTGIMDFPNGVQVAILLNSDFVAANLPHLAAYENDTPYQLEAVKRSFENAWPEISIVGTAGPDTLEIRRNPNDSGAVDIYLNDDLVVTRWVETLEKVTLSGVGGDDTFFVDPLPHNIDVVIQGGVGDDTINVLDNQILFAVQGKVTVHGGPDSDTLVFDEATMIGAATYTVTDDTLTKSSRPGAVEYEDLEEVLVHAGSDNDTIRVNATDTGVHVRVFGDAGDDTITLGNRDLSVHLGDSVWVDGGADDDQLSFDDRDGGNPEDFYVLETDYFTQGGYSGLVHHAAVETLTLLATNQVNTINVRGTQAGQDVTISGRGGADTVRMHAAASGSVVNVLGGSGNDTVELSPEDRDLDHLQGTVNVDGGDGTADEIVVYDQDDNVAGRTYGVSAAGVTRSGAFGGLDYENIEQLDVRANDSGDDIYVNSLSAAVDLTVRAGAGDDHIIVGGLVGDLDTNILGDLAVYGGADDDTLQLNDGSDDIGNDSYLLSSNQFSKSFTQTWSYLQTENVILNASAFDNTVQLSSVVPVDLTINAWLGDDTIVLGTGRADLIMADVHVNGSLGHNVIIVNNQDAPGGHTYTFAGQSFDMSGAFFDSLSYTSIDDVVLNAGTSNDTIDVQSSVLSTDIEVFGNDGDDTFNVATGDVDLIGGDLVIHGGNDDDAAIINDQNDLGNDTYTVTTNQVSKPNFLLLYDGLESLTLNAGADDNTININNTLPGTSTIVNAGAGNDTIHLSPLAKHLGQIHGAVLVNGQAGNDKVFAHDEVFALGAISPYTLTRTKMGRAGFGGLTFDTIERLQLNLGTGNDTVNVTEFNRDVLFALYGNAGVDTFNVTVFPSALDTGGHLFIDGGSPRGKKSGDCLNVSYASKPKVPKKPKVHHKKSPPKRAGTITVEYPAAIYDIQYTDVEKVKLAKL